MTDPQTAQSSAIRLAELSNEVEELEASRLLLIQRLEKLRAQLLESGNRTATIRASVDFLSEQLTDIAIAQMDLLEAELREVGLGVENSKRESVSLLFESSSIEETIAEAEDELERLSQSILEGKAKTPRGH
jgi:chromosome segregation ATPase